MIYRLTSRLKDLMPNQGAAFAASCCERVRPFYYHFVALESWKGPSNYDDILEQVWQCIQQQSAPEQKVQRLIAESELLLPDEEEEGSSTNFFSTASGAVSVLQRTLGCVIDPKPEVIASVPEIVTDTIDEYLHLVAYNYDNDVNTLEFNKLLEDWIADSPIMQIELRKQDQDLKLIQEQELTTALIEQIKKTSRQHALKPSR